MTTKCATDSLSSPTHSPTLMVTQTTVVTNKNRKRPPPLFLPHVANKKRRAGLVRRTHSPKTVPSPLSSPVNKRPSKAISCEGGFEVHRVAPTVKGVAEGARVLAEGQIFAIPTETTYYYCTTMDVSRRKQPQTPDSTNSQGNDDTTNDTKVAAASSCEPAVNPLSDLFEHEHPKAILLVRSPSELDRVMTLVPKAYAIHSTQDNNNKIPPVSFHEGREVLRRLACRYWPGPMPMHMSCCKSGLNHVSCHGTEQEKVDLPVDALHQLSSLEDPDCSFVGMRCPSHPLTGRVLNDVGNKSRIVLAVNASIKNGEYLTKAQDVCQHLVSKSTPGKRRKVHVLNGEDKREAFVVPTCQYGHPCLVELWIHTRTRTVYICSSPAASEQEDIMTKLTTQDVERALQQATSRDPKRQNRNRVMTAVLRKWKVVDKRSN